MAKKKATQGRAKQKQKAQKAGNASWSRPSRGDWSDDEEEESNVTFRGFGGVTSRRTTFQDPAVKLRNRSIAFVSAGTSTPQDADQKEVEVDEGLIAAIELNDSDDMDVIPADDEEVRGIAQLDGSDDMMSRSVDGVAQPPPRALLAEQVEHDIIAEEPITFVVDTIGDSAAVQLPKTSPVQYRALSLTPSDSSEEVILFQGRNRPVVVDDPIQQAPQVRLTHHQSNTVPRPSSLDVDTATTSDTIPPAATSSSLAASAEPAPWQGVPATPFWRKTGVQNIEELAQRQAELDSHAEHVSIDPASSNAHKHDAEETIQMLQAAWKQAKKEKHAAKGTTKELSKRGKRGRKQSNRILRDAGPDDDDPEVAAYQDYLENIRAQADEDPIEADIPDIAGIVNDEEQEWEDTEMTAGDSDESDIIGDDLDDVLGSDDDDDANASDLDSSELEEELNGAEDDMMRAQDMLDSRRLQSKSDAQIARLWAKQLELGIDAEELVIDDGDFESDGVGDIQAARAGLAEYTAFAIKSGKRSKRRGKGDMSFPDASAMADAIEQYGNEGFDIMDYERPSLRATKNGRKGRVPPELEALSDDELRENMLSTWDKDRIKKRLKKAEREELRTQGLLGPLAKKGKADLGQKYQQGMDMEQVCAELAVFMGDDGKTTQPFPPMDKADRQALHIIAGKLNLKSKSVGSGKDRFPVLYKTRNTVEFNEASFNRIIRSSSKHFLKNQAWSKGGKKAANIPKRSGGGSGMGATSLRHGELVGAGAKEIGEDNFGHRLMEKMGWSKGMALGKDGEGRLQPVEQMMRVGRAGL